MKKKFKMHVKLRPGLKIFVEHWKYRVTLAWIVTYYMTVWRRFNLASLATFLRIAKLKCLKIKRR